MRKRPATIPYRAASSELVVIHDYRNAIEPLPRHGVFRCARAVQASEKISAFAARPSNSQRVGHESSDLAAKQCINTTARDALCIRVPWLFSSTDGSVVESTPHPCRSRLARSSKRALFNRNYDTLRTLSRDMLAFLRRSGETNVGGGRSIPLRARSDQGRGVDSKSDAPRDDGINYSRDAAAKMTYLERDPVPGVESDEERTLIVHAPH